MLGSFRKLRKETLKTGNYACFSYMKPLEIFDSLNICFGRNVKQFKTIAPTKIKKLFVILLWYCRNRTKDC